MAKWKDFRPEEQREMLRREMERYERIKAGGLKLDLSRGKPGPEALDISNALLAAIDDYRAEDGTDCRNYGMLTGLPEVKRLFSDLLGIDSGKMLVGGNSSLFHMYNVFFQLYMFGAPGTEPWSKQDKVKIICPVPGYDRHFSLTSDFGAEMIPVDMLSDGPDMDAVEKLVSDPDVKGIWLVPLYSNPTGCVCSHENARRLAGMTTAAADFRIFWDNAYGVHHLWEECSAPDILALCDEAGHPERAYYFFSTSKVTFPGAGISLMATGPANLKQYTEHLTKQTIGFDKLNQLRFFRMFEGKADNVKKHMKKLADILRPKFEFVMKKLDDEFEGTALLTYERPRGGYFISVDVPQACALRTVKLAREAGAVLTQAGATWPYGVDPKDSNIRIAPTYPSPEELEATMELFCVCVKIAALESFLGENEGERP